MIDMNSPCPTVSETLSTATTGPSGVSKRTWRLSTARMVSPEFGLDVSATERWGTEARSMGGSQLLFAAHCRGHGGGVTGFNAHVDHGDVVCFDGGNGLGEC